MVRPDRIGTIRDQMATRRKVVDQFSETRARPAVLVYSAIGVLWRDIRAIWAETVGLHLGSPEQSRLATLGQRGRRADRLMV